MTVRHFCTYFDSRYLSRGLALIESLRRHCPAFQIWVLCLDETSHAALARLGLPNVSLISLDEFERGDSALLASKSDRSLVEYYFTCTPSLPLFVLRREPDVDLLTYVDADLFFFASPEPLFAEIGDESIGIVPHRFPESGRHWERCGIFNVGWITFRRDAHALACLTWWRERCLEWCYDRVEPDRFADQKYLDTWPERFTGVHVFQHKGANVASWNLRTHPVSSSGGQVFVGGDPLVFFHFHHFNRRRAWLFETHLGLHEARVDRLVKRDIFAPYLRAIEAQRIAVDRVIESAGDARAIRESLQHRPPLRIMQMLRDLRAGSSLLYINGRVW